MPDRIIRRYSLAFQQQVVSELESGRFASISQARRHYEIGGAETIVQWIRKLGKNHLLPKVVRVQQVDEPDRIGQLKAQIAQLQRALGQTQAEKVLSESYLKLACEQLGQEVDDFRKKHGGVRCTPRRSRG